MVTGPKHTKPANMATGAKVPGHYDGLKSMNMIMLQHCVDSSFAWNRNLEVAAGLSCGIWTVVYGGIGRSRIGRSRMRTPQVGPVLAASRNNCQPHTKYQLEQQSFSLYIYLYTTHAQNHKSIKEIITTI